MNSLTETDHTLGNSANPPRIRSFVRRQGRLTEGQQLALAQYWDKYCLTPNQRIDPAQVFANAAPVVVEIGFGNGTSLASMALANPSINYIGIEVHRPGVGHLLWLLHSQGIENVRIYCHDAIEILEHCLAEQSLFGVLLFFPDPWHKRKHHKRRIVRPEFLALLQQKLQPNGYLHIATDWSHYAQSIVKLMASQSQWRNQSPSNDYCPRPSYRPLTKFEQRGLRLGHGVWDLIFIKNE